MNLEEKKKKLATREWNKICTADWPRQRQESKKKGTKERKKKKEASTARTMKLFRATARK
jgi:hypothetical protein